MKLLRCTKINLDRLRVGDKFIYKNGGYIEIFLILKLNKSDGQINMTLKLIKSNRLPDRIGVIATYQTHEKNYENQYNSFFRCHFIEFQFKNKLKKLLQL